MFLSDGKTLFGNSGLIISICILLILLYFTYNKCYINNDINNDISPIEYFHIDPVMDADNLKLPIPEEVRINISGGTILLDFKFNKIQGVQTPSKFILILAQYDSNKKNTGNNKFFLSNEYDLTSTVQVNDLSYNTNVCTLIDGVPICKYKFTNVDIRDADNNLFYYKIGVSAIYNNYNTPFIMPYNIRTIDNFFTIESSTLIQNQQYSDFLTYQKTLDKTKNPQGKNIYDTTISTADGKYELIKSQLGDYPNNLLIDDQMINNATLNDLVDKNMSQGIINIDVKMN